MGGVLIEGGAGEGGALLLVSRTVLQSVRRTRSVFSVETFVSKEEADKVFMCVFLDVTVASFSYGFVLDAHRSDQFLCK